MGFDYVWKIEPHAVGEDDTVQYDAWVDLDRSDSSVAPFFLSIGGQVPVASRTVRLRWVAGLSTRSELIDHEGNRWVVRELKEIGRRKWIDLSIATVDLQTGVDPLPEVPLAPPVLVGEAPAGWRLVDSAGTAVLTFGAALITPDHNALMVPCLETTCPGIRLWLDPMWFFSGGEWDPTQEFAASIDGVECVLGFQRSLLVGEPVSLGSAYQGALDDIDAPTVSGLTASGLFFRNQPSPERQTRQRVWPYGRNGDLWLSLSSSDEIVWPDAVIHGFTVASDA